MVLLWSYYRTLYCGKILRSTTSVVSLFLEHNAHACIHIQEDEQSKKERNKQNEDCLNKKENRDETLIVSTSDETLNFAKQVHAPAEYKVFHFNRGRPSDFTRPPPLLLPRSFQSFACSLITHFIRILKAVIKTSMLGGSDA